MKSIGVAVAHPDPGVADELVHAIEAEADLYLALDPEKAAVVLAGAPSQLTVPPGVAVVGLSAEQDLAAVAREALRCGAHDVLAWPRERHAFRSIVRDAASRARLGAAGADGKIVAVAGARGGAGTTTVAALLARAITGSAVVDLDTAGAGQASFLVDGAEPTFGDVLAAIDDLDPPAFSAALVAHAAGRALCARPRTASPSAAQTERLVALLRAAVPASVCDLGPATSDAAMSVLGAADVVVVVCAPDVASMRGARALDATYGKVVLNQAGRLRLSARDVERVLGAPPAAVVPWDAAVRRAGESGRLPRRGAAVRAVDRLAATLVKDGADGS